MKIILNKDVQNLGEEGDVREVAPGYARNYLLPKGLGVTYTKQNLALLEGKRKAIEKRKEEKKEQAAGLKERIESRSLQITMTVGENGRLFGSVTNAMIADELAKDGIEVERKRIEIPEHTIKNTGNFVVKVKLYANEVASLKVTVSGPAGTQPEETAAEAPGEGGDEAASAVETAENEAVESESAETEAAEAAAEPATESGESEATAEAATETATEPPAAESAESETVETEAPVEAADEQVGEATAPEKGEADEPAADAADEEPADRE